MKFIDGLAMKTHGRTKWIVAILLGVGACCLPAFADEVYTYTYQGDFLQIPADQNASQGQMNDAVINIDYHLIISDLDVTITITHSNVFDLQIFLQSPDGTTLCLNSYDPDNGFFKGADYSQTVFDDEALTNIGNTEPPFTGQFRPDSLEGLKIFDGQDAYGPWHLQICDMWDYDTGTLESFALTIITPTIITPEPATVVLLALGAGLVTLLKPRRNLKNF